MTPVSVIFLTTLDKLYPVNEEGIGAGVEPALDVDPTGVFKSIIPLEYSRWAEKGKDIGSDRTESKRLTGPSFEH